MTNNPTFLWDDCTSIEEQRARVFRRWLADPDGRYDERWDNDRLLKISIMFLIHPLLRRSTDQRVHEYWSDGIHHLECQNKQMTDLRFSGTSRFLIVLSITSGLPHLNSMCVILQKTPMNQKR